MAFAANSSRRSKATWVRFSGWLKRSNLRSASSCASPDFAPAFMVSSIEPCSFPASQSLAARSAMVSAARSTGGLETTVAWVVWAKVLNVGPNSRLNARNMANSREEIIEAFYSGFGLAIVVFRSPPVRRAPHTCRVQRARRSRGRFEGPQTLQCPSFGLPRATVRHLRLCRCKCRSRAVSDAFL